MLTPDRGTSSQPPYLTVGHRIATTRDIALTEVVTMSDGSFTP